SRNAHGEGPLRRLLGALREEPPALDLGDRAALHRGVVDRVLLDVHIGHTPLRVDGDRVAHLALEVGVGAQGLLVAGLQTRHALTDGRRDGLLVDVAEHVVGGALGDAFDLALLLAARPDLGRTFAGLQALVARDRTGRVDAPAAGHEVADLSASILGRARHALSKQLAEVVLGALDDIEHRALTRAAV